VRRIFIGVRAYPKAFIDFDHVERVEQFSQGNPHHREIPTAEYRYPYRRWVLHLRGGRLALTSVQNLGIGKRTCSTLREIEAALAEIQASGRLAAWRRKRKERGRRFEDAWTARYMRAKQAERESGYHRDHVKVLARTGKVEAIKRGGQWWVDREDLQRYQANTRPGPRPKGKPNTSECDTTTQRAAQGAAGL